MKKIFALVAVLLCLSLSADYIQMPGSGGGGGAPSGPAGGDLGGTYPSPTLSVAKEAELDGKITGPASATANSLALFDGITGKLQKFGPFLTVTDNGSDRLRFNSDNFEWRPAIGGNPGEFIYIADRQLTLAEKNLYFENVTNGIGFGSVWWDVHNAADIGMSNRDDPGVKHGPRKVYVGTSIEMGSNTSAQNIEALGDNRMRIRTNQLDVYSQGLGNYMEHLMGGFTPNRVQTNVQIHLNASDMHFTDINGNNDGGNIGDPTVNRPDNVYVKTKVQTDGNFVTNVAGGGLKIKEGSNARMGVSTLVAGTVSVSNTSVTASSRIFLSCNDANGGTPGALYVSARAASTSFDITSTSVLDTCIVAWHMIEPAP